MNRPFAPKDASRRGPEHYWAEMQRFGERGFTYDELLARCRGVTRATVKTYVLAMARLGMVATVEQAAARGGANARCRYAVVKAAGSAPLVRHPSRPFGRQGQIQQHLWTAMRGLDGFLVRELAAAASTEALVISPGTAQTYVSRLLKAGLLLVVAGYTRARRGTAGATPGRYRLKPSADTGPMPPKVLGNRVFDPNRRAFVGAPIDGTDAAEREDAA